MLEGLPEIINMECMKDKSRVTAGVWIQQANRLNSILGDKELSLNIVG